MLFKNRQETVISVNLKLLNKMMRYSKLLVFLLFATAFNSAVGTSLCFGQSKSDSIKAIWENDEESVETRFAAFEAYFQLHVLSNPKEIIASSEPHFELAQKVESKHELLLVGK
ncbi:MAG: hypothetical protein P8P74_08905 [Crocinitomicaceae bacterium]|nr:hypothetical protein [Crocinitomicaceae bacterium]